MNADRRGEMTKRGTVTELFVENTFCFCQPLRGCMRERGGLAKRFRHHLQREPFDHDSRGWIRQAEFAIEPCRQVGEPSAARIDRRAGYFRRPPLRMIHAGIAKLKIEAAGASVKVIGMCFACWMKENASWAAMARLFATSFSKTASENETKIGLLM